MNLGLIADIHGDLEGLQKALACLSVRQVDQIVCAGDMVKKGPQSVEVIELLQAQGIACIAGNHEREAVDAHKFDDQTNNFLSVLPQSLRLNLVGKRILVAHGAPWSDFVYIYPQTERHVFKRVAREANADVLVLGHTHLPLVAEVDSTLIVNPGSICGTHTSGSRTCGILALPGCSFEVLRIDDGKPIDAINVKIRR